ncbi:TRAP transporter large permease subunit [Agrobacterium vitis]|uniref:TRAP transporter large permease protein n=1 Tax=Agrobacterium vitis TaxID=373 RepID=A0ABD6GE86_AGRVI|nr:TRAP transporter large permease [Agrobacterium vitis]MUO79954.1 TRAP transporter large permease subunit [Agrobacterium vitis]MUO93557.1 TRAP transporter large permease subunit [Agrobacterium vitis]MUP04192.1 TRAP transporter large permease subunit [Agrobacterium vitis]MUZ84324.1 TRAP transporter large permease subunit [Agrobacterium vitis]MVA11115.1 TRAP transporter large permease subunit [Agrobacterium vitis]
MTVAVLILSFSFLLLIGVPIAWCMGVASLLTIYAGHLGLPFAWFAQQTIRGADAITLAAIPLFLFAGELMNRGGLTTRIMRVAEHVFGRITGGLGLVNVATALVYGGISGSATADTGAVGSIMIPAMAERGYPKAFAAAVTAASGTLGIIGPQSVILILYGVLTNTSIGGLLVAALLPGLFIAVTFMVTSYIVAKRHNFPRNETPAQWGEIGRDALGALPALLMPVLVLGSIIGGIATATEASALAVVYSFLVGIFVYRELPLRSLYSAASAAVATTGVIMMIMALATPFGWILTVEQVPANAAAWITGLHTTPLVTIILVLVLLKVVGFWLDLGPALIILAPILVPIALAAGMTPYQTGIVFTMTLGIGLFTPPIGTNIFVVCNVAKIDMWSVSKWLVPYWIASVVCVAALVAFPILTEWLPSLFGV